MNSVSSLIALSVILIVALPDVYSKPSGGFGAGMYGPGAGSPIGGQSPFAGFGGSPSSGGAAYPSGWFSGGPSGSGSPQFPQYPQFPQFPQFPQYPQLPQFDYNQLYSMYAQPQKEEVQVLVTED